MARKVRPWLVAVALLSVLLVLVAACGGGGNPLIGKWEDKTLGMVYEFTADNKLILSMSGITLEGQYELPDSSHVKITVADMGESITLNYSISGDKLTLTDDSGETQELVRVP